MVTQAIPSQQIVTGSDILNLGALLAQTAAQTQLAFQDQAGYYDPSLFGSMNGFQPTLGRDQLSLQRDQLNATIADAQRQYNLDVQRFGLETANLNYQQRLGEAQTRLQQLGLLSSLRGPSDYLAYNYVLNNMAAPPGQAVDPFKMTQGLNQPYVAPPLPNVPQPPPTSAPRPPAGGGGTGGGGGAAPQSSSAAPRAVAPPSSTGIAISGNPQADASLRNQWASQGADPATLAEFDRISQNMANTYANAVAQNPNFQLFNGGIVHGGSALVGDSKSGRPTGHEELVVSDYPFAVLPHDVIKGSEMNAPHAANGMFPNFQFPAGFGGQQGSGNQQQYNHQSNYGQYNGQMPDVMPSPVEQPGAGYQQGYPGMNGSSLRQFWQQYAQSHGGQTPQTPPQAGTLPQIPAYLQSIMSWIQQRPAAGGNMMDWIHAFPGYPQTPVSAATGGTFTGSGAGSDPGQGFFNFNTHTPAQTQNAPFVQQTLGNQSSPAFQQRGQPLGPFGAQPFSYTNYLSLLPSAQQMLQGYIETPTAMGGLAGNFQDELERSRRAAGTGISFGPSTYGG